MAKKLTRVQQREKALKEIKETFEKHIGHSITFNRGVHAQTWKVLRVTFDDEYVKVWTEGLTIFGNSFFYDQAVSCSCGEGQTKGE